MIPAKEKSAPEGAPGPASALGTLAYYFATGIVNSAPLAMLSGQRCITLL